MIWSVTITGLGKATGVSWEYSCSSISDIHVCMTLLSIYYGYLDPACFPLLHGSELPSSYNLVSIACI